MRGNFRNQRKVTLEWAYYQSCHVINLKIISIELVPQSHFSSGVDNDYHQHENRK